MSQNDEGPGTQLPSQGGTPNSSLWKRQREPSSLPQPNAGVFFLERSIHRDSTLRAPDSAKHRLAS